MLQNQWTDFVREAVYEYGSGKALPRNLHVRTDKVRGFWRPKPYCTEQRFYLVLTIILTDVPIDKYSECFVSSHNFGEFLDHGVDNLVF